MSGLWTGHYVCDPSEIEARYSEEDAISNTDSIFTEPDEESARMLERVREIMETLPELEADFVDLYYFKNMRQTAIAEIFKVSQPTVCYRLQRATARIQFLLRLPDVNEQDIRRDLKEILADDLFDLEIMVLMFHTTCQSEVAKLLGVSQGLVRHRFIRSLEKIRKQLDLEVYVQLFEEISNNLNILREIRRSTSDSKATHVVD